MCTEKNKIEVWRPNEKDIKTDHPLHAIKKIILVGQWFGGIRVSASIGRVPSKWRSIFGFLVLLSLYFLGLIPWMFNGTEGVKDLIAANLNNMKERG